MARPQKSQQSMTPNNSAGVTQAGQARGVSPPANGYGSQAQNPQVQEPQTYIASQQQMAPTAYPQGYDEYSEVAASLQAIPQQTFHQSPHPPSHSEQAMQTNGAPMPQASHHSGQVQPGQTTPGPPPQYPPQQSWDSPAPQNHPQQYARGYAQAVAGQQGYRPAQSQVGQAQMSQAHISPQASQMSTRQAHQPPVNPVAQSSALQRSRRQLLVESPQAPLASHGPGPQRSFGPTQPTQYLQRNAQAPVQPPPQQSYGRDQHSQPYGHEPSQGQRQLIVGGTAGWTGGQHPARQHLASQYLVGQSSALRRQRLASQVSSINRRSRYELDEDFVPSFGRATPVAPSSFSWPVINWHNLPLGNMRFWTALGGIVFAAIMLNVLGTSPVISSIVKTRNRQCQEVVQNNSVLSRQQLTQLLAVPERSPKANIHDIIREPYCLLPSLNIRAGVNAVREAYPLEFDPDTWIVVLYEGDEYAGYRFNAR